MKQIKDYLHNQKDVFMAMWITELNKEQPNMAMVEHYNKMYNCCSLMLQTLTDKKTIN